MASLLSFSTNDNVLHFKLDRNVAPKASLKMTNISSSKAIFKVRTTQPMWYFVRPNQDLIEAGQTIELIFTLTEPECNRFLDLYREGSPESVDKHRFLIQAKPIDSSDYDMIMNKPADSPNRASEVNRFYLLYPYFFVVLIAV